MLNLQGKHALILGVASESSLAWGIAQKLDQAGARVSLGYQQQFKSRILKLVKSGEVPLAFCDRCDVTDPEEMKKFFSGIKIPIDILVHSIAYASPETFHKPVHEITEEEFGNALNVSSYSLIPLVRAFLPHMSKEASVMAMSYLGGHRVVANYKLMGIAKAALEAIVRELAVDLGPQGIRVNAISAGPVRTLAASQIKDFDEMLQVYDAVSPLRRCIAQEDVANLALFLGSDLSRNITGQTIFVDAGYSIVAMATYPGPGGVR